MKKFIFIALAALLAFALVTCDDMQGGNTLGYTDVEFSADGKSLTIYLDGTTVPVTKQSRALTKELAEIGYDFFEVVFLADATSVTTIASTIVRTSWEIGQAAGVKVIRGVDYDLVDPTAADGANGAAILFVGRKIDKALLGIGKLTSTDTGGTIISPTTTKVTFTVAALQAGASFTNAVDTSGANDVDDTTALYPTNTSFRVDTLTEIVTVKEDFGRKEFPAYLVPIGNSNATFTLGSSDITTGSPDVDEIDTYLPAVMIADDPVVEKRIPRFISGSQYKEIKSPYSKATVDITNNNVTDVALVNPVTFDIDSVTGDDGFIAFTFKIPVYAMNTAVNATDNIDPVTWYIRPGFGTDYYNLDDGKAGAGGALLLAIGDAIDDYIEIVTVNK